MRSNVKLIPVICSNILNNERKNVKNVTNDEKYLLTLTIRAYY